MNTKKPLLAIAAVALFALASCTSTNASDDATYEAVDQTKIKMPTNGVDQTKIKMPTNG